MEVFTIFICVYFGTLILSIFISNQNKLDHLFSKIKRVTTCSECLSINFDMFFLLKIE